MWQLIALVSSHAAANSCPAYPGNDTNKLWYIQTNTTVYLTQISTTVRPGVVSPDGASVYLTELSCLGYYGPIGPYGPLGILGPLGDASWSSASYWISGGFGWDDWAKTMTGMGGPLSSDGPLGSQGPMTERTIYGTVPCINDYGHHLIGGGLWSVLGPLGPLGALGALGPLGPVGSHGYLADSNGRYLDKKGIVMRNVTVKYDSKGTKVRAFELFERYKQGYANTMTSQDTSFMVDGTYSSTSPEKNIYPIISAHDQLVTILVVPAYQLDAFSLTVVDGSMKHNITSTYTMTYPPWVQLHMRAGEKMFVKVVNEYSAQYLYPNDYKLYVTGSTSEFKRTDISGPHMRVRSP